jgi:hypothetical protein
MLLAWNNANRDGVVNTYTLHAAKPVVKGREICHHQMVSHAGMGAGGGCLEFVSLAGKGTRSLCNPAMGWWLKTLAFADRLKPAARG